MWLGVHCGRQLITDQQTAVPIAAVEVRLVNKRHLTVMLALPMSPVVENLMPSLVTEMLTVSPMPLRSLQSSPPKNFLNTSQLPDPCLQHWYLCRLETWQADVSGIGD